ncbi:hypothetical protein EKK58_00125 [Candidatus Dependentiae bacterium]|nr:MAG: hypothetical protein EKK58_00125 [Candidatus Dependentiae bacterium]
MYQYTPEHHVQLLNGEGHPLTRNQAFAMAQISEDETEFPIARFSRHYGRTRVDCTGDDNGLWVLLYDTGYSSFPIIPIHFSTLFTTIDLYLLMRDRPVAWLFDLLGWQRPPGNPPYGRLLMAEVDARRGCGLSQMTVAQINSAFFMLALRTPGVWHGKLSEALGVPLTGRKTQLFRGALINGQLVPRRLHEGGIVLRPVRQRR